jgi:exonuclease III
MSEGGARGIDVCNPRDCLAGTHVSERDRKEFGRLSSARFVSAFRLHHLEPGRYTWWDYRTDNLHKNFARRGM